MNDTLSSVRNRLVEHGRSLFDDPRRVVKFTNDPEADGLLEDLGTFPHAFVIACVMDRRIKAERAWLIPHRIRERLGKFSMPALSALSKSEITRLMMKPTPLHLYSDVMGKLLYSAIRRISLEYASDAASNWRGSPSSAEVVYRFLEFEGVGPKIATMAANIIARDFKIPFSDYYSIDISADVHVHRVFRRLGLCEEDASIEQIIYKARAMNPEFPGQIDLPCWEIGRNWCRPRKPLCGECYMNSVCPSAFNAV